MALSSLVLYATYRNADDDSNCDSGCDSNCCLPIVCGCEEFRILKGSVHCGCGGISKCALDLGGAGTILPPTSVSCAPRRMALGSKLDMVGGFGAKVRVG
jgi:hypothetical protein